MRQILTKLTLALSVVLLTKQSLGQCSPDIQPPTITSCPPNTTYFVDVAPAGSCVHTITSTEQSTLYPVASDNCTPPPSLAYQLTYFPNGQPSVGPILNPILTGIQLPPGPNIFVWRVIDAAGNISTSCTYIITVVDNTPPDITCGVTGPQNVTANATCKFVAPSAWNATATDNCLVNSLTYALTGVTTGTGTDLNGVQFNLGTTTVTWTATDNATTPNTSTCSFTVVVTDVTPPVLTCNNTANQNLNTDAGECNYTQTTSGWNASATDNCTVASVLANLTGATIASNLTTLTGQDFALGTTTVTWTATDGSGNTTTCSFQVTVTDIEPPVAICQNITVQLDATGNATITPADIDNGSNDACGIQPLVIDISSFDCSSVGPNTVELTVTDNNGNSSTCTATVTVEDNVDPVAICQNITVQLDATGNASITPADIDNGSNDACGIQPLVIDVSSFDCSNVGPNTVELTVTDNNGNISTCTAIVTVEDNINPVAICQNITAQLDATGSVTILPADIDNGSNDACGIQSLTLDITSFDCTNIGVNSVELTVTDNNGNTATCSATVTVEDNVAPTALCQNITVQLDATGNATITPADIDNGSNDACGIQPLVIDVSSFDCSNVGPNTVELTVTDINGNISTCTSIVTVEDNVDPIAICQNLTVQLDAAGTATIAPAEVDNGSNDVCGIQSLALDITSFDCTNVGPNTVELTVTDNNGNTATCSATVTVEDNVDPVAICQNITVQLDATGNATITPSDIDNGSNDACGIQPLIIDVSSFDCSNVGPNTVELTVTDNNGNTATCTATVTVEDNVAPIITCTQFDTLIISADPGVCSYLHTGTNWDATVAIDNCDPSPVIAYVLTDVIGNQIGSGNSLDNVTFAGITNVIWTATDLYGNVGTCSFVVLIEDSIPPVIDLCTSDQSVITDPSVCTYTVPDVSWDINGTDNCGTVSYIYNLGGATNNTIITSLANATLNLGITTVEAILFDGAGNSDTCNFNITVSDTELPVITSCGAIIDTVVVADAGVCTYTNNGTGWDAVATDNCSIDSISYVLSGATTASGLTTLDGMVFGLDTTLVTWMVTDGSGNTTTCSFNVIVQETELPVITTCGVVTDTNVVADLGVCTYTNIGSGWDALGTDNCSIDSISYVLSGSTVGNGLTTLDGVAFNNGTTTVAWTVTDGSGNTATCQFDVIVTDTQAPVIAAVLNDTTVECSPVDPVAFDNCGPVTGVSDFTTYTGDTVVVVTWTFTDAAGNTTTSSQTITYDDVTGPDTPVIADAVAECDTTVSAATASDLCMGTISGTTTDPLTYTAQGTYTITWTFDDTNGNTTTATQTVIIQDVTAPTIVAPATVNVYPNNAGCTAIIPDLGTPVTTDNCQVVSVTNDGPGTYPLGATTVTWTVTDIGGNSTTATQTVNVLPLTSILDTVACDVYISPDGIDLTSFGSGTYTAVIPGSFGCDSTITINLTLNQSSSSTITLAACDLYTAPDGAIYNNSGVYTAIIPNAAGCDSTITINLTIDSIETVGVVLNDMVLTALQATDVTYQWVSCDNGYSTIFGATQQSFDVLQYPLPSGDYAVILTNNTCVDTSECVNISIETIIPQLVTPNGDGSNDVFEIQGVYDYPNNILEIYNRWGNLVYRQESYQNNWGGECTEGLTLGGDILPTGTYFFIFDKGLNDGNKPVKGYIFLTK